MAPTIHTRRDAAELLVALAVLFCAGCISAPWKPVYSDDALERFGPEAPDPHPRLRAKNGFFVAPDGRTVILRGVNIAGDAKVPPFMPFNLGTLEELPSLGANVIRLVFNWEAFEPSPGQYDQGYLALMERIADVAWARRIYVIIDFHEDAYSRFTDGGCGEGFPRWATDELDRDTPDDGSFCRLWYIVQSLSTNVDRSFRMFFSGRGIVRERYLQMVQLVAAHMSRHEGVVGYDLLNEPWASESQELAPLYRDAAIAIRSRDGGAIMFIEPNALTVNVGGQSALARMPTENGSYAPHYYDPVLVFLKRWFASTRTSAARRAFENMRSKARALKAPLFIGEFGSPAPAVNARQYLILLYDLMDRTLASGAQWAYTPGWRPKEKDGWDREDFSIVAADAPRSTFVLRPYPQRIAGTPEELAVGLDPPRLVFRWRNDPSLGGGVTELFAPRDSVFGKMPRVESSDPDIDCRYSEPDHLVMSCRSQVEGEVRIGIQ